MRFRNVLSAATVALTALAGSVASAATIDLGFAIDESGSVSGAPNVPTSELGLIREGLASALDLIPSVGATGNPNTYTVTIVRFAGSAQPLVSKTVIDDASRAAIQNTLRTEARIGGGTNIPSAVNLLTQEVCGFGAGTCTADTTLFNIATDGSGGNPATSGANAAALLAGVDGISYEAIGGGLSSDSILDFAFPGTPIVVTDAADLPNPTTTGFVFEVATFEDFEDAAAAKIGRIVTDTGGGGGGGAAVIPLPAAGWLLLAGVAGLFGLRRRA